MARLGDVFALQITGEWGMECQDGDIGIPVLRTTNFTSIGEIDYTKIAHRSIAISKVQKKKLLTGDIILEKSGGTDNIPVGRVVFCDSRIQEATYLCNNFTQAMRPDLSVVCPKYLFYVMWNLHQSGATDLMQNKTTGIRNLQVLRYLDTKIPLPPLDEQKGIADTLDRISDLLANRKQQLAKLDELVKSRFIEMFGDPVVNSMNWTVLNLDECLAGIENGKSFVCSNEARRGTAPAVLKLSAATYGDYRPQENKAMFNSAMFVASAEVHGGDLLFTRKNTPELVGMCAYVTDTPRNLMMPDLIFRLNINEKCDKIYVWKLINHPLFRNNIASITSGSAKSMSNISKERLGKLKIPVPPLALQTQFAAFVAQIDKSKFEIQKSLEKLETLKKALMQQYFG